MKIRSCICFTTLLHPLLLLMDRIITLFGNTTKYNQMPTVKTFGTLSVQDNYWWQIDGGETINQLSSVTTVTDSWSSVHHVPDGSLLFRGMSLADLSLLSVTNTDGFSDGHGILSLIYANDITDGHCLSVIPRVIVRRWYMAALSIGY